MNKNGPSNIIHEADIEHSNSDPRAKKVYDDPRNSEVHFSQDASIMKDSYQDEPEDPEFDGIDGRCSRPSQHLLSNLSDLVVSPTLEGTAENM